MGARVNEFSDNPWYDRGGQYGWAIDGRQTTAPLVHQTAASIEASLPSNLKDNAYAYARATFDWLNTNVPYDTAAPNVGSQRRAVFASRNR